MPDYYVDPVLGNNLNPGTVLSPWLDAEHAGQTVLPGDTAYYRGGIYTGPRNTFDSSINTLNTGVPGNYITHRAYPGESPIFRPPDGFTGIKLTTGAPAYLSFIRLAFDGVNQTSDVEGVYISDGSNHNLFTEIEVHHWRNFGVAVSRNNGHSPFNYFINCNVHHQGDPLGLNNTRGHGYYINTQNTLIQGGYIYDNEGYGIHNYDNSGQIDLDNNIYTGIEIYNNGAAGHTVGFGIVLAWGNNCLASNNVIYNNLGGVQLYTNGFGEKVLNNTIYGNRDFGVFIQFVGSDPKIKNNIIYSNSTDIFGTSSDMSNNLLSDPSFINPGAFDFHIDPGSAAENGGITLPEVPIDKDGFSRPQNTNYSIGAYEVPNITPPPPTPLIIPRGARSFTISYQY